MASFSPFREELRRAWWELRGADLSPLRGAAAVAIGLVIGSQPIFGLHAPLLLGLCLWLRLDFAIAYLAANISNPFFAPALITFEVQLGAYLRTGETLRFEHLLTRAHAASQFASDLAVGAPLLGLGLGALGGALTYAGIALKRRLRPRRGPRKPYRLPADAPPWVHAVERVAGRYAPADGGTARDRSRFHYVRSKLLGDPIARLIADIADVEGDTPGAPGALGEIVDIGTGRGQLPILLLELGRASKAFGVDWDAEKIEAANAAAAVAKRLDATFAAGDAREVDVPPADTVLLIDLLHYFKVEEQDRILYRAASAVRPGGRILIREADPSLGWRSFATLLEERIFTAIRFNRGERVRFRPAREIQEILETAGLRVEIRPAWGKTPFSNVLVIGRRDGARD